MYIIFELKITIGYFEQSLPKTDLLRGIGLNCGWSFNTVLLTARNQSFPG